MRRLAISILALLAIAVPALAQQEPPARVGRVSFVEGQLTFHATGEAQWSAAAVNYPVATGGAFATDPQSRAEIRIGVQTIDIAGGTEVDITKLNQQVMQIALPQGRINLRLQALPQGNTVAIDIPRGGVWLLEPGIYDITAGAQDQPSRVAVFEGNARFVGGPIDLGIKAGDAAVIDGWDTLTATVERAAPDDFAQWSRSRDYHPKQLAAQKYVSPQMTGYEELDQYGSWGTAPDYGQVWYPSAVPADWAPYSQGHWVSVEPWGWTWVDVQPWGFAPCHYGRWARIHDRWGWVPGRFVPQPIYAPALVAFIGDPRVGVALAGGPAVGWFPLAPNEVYWPSYTRDRTYIRNVNSTNVSDARFRNIAGATGNRTNAGPPPQVVNQSFANRNAATVVPVHTFASAANVAPAALHVAPQTLRQAPVSVRPPEVTPTATHVAPAQPAAAPTATAPATAPATHPPGAATATPPATAPATHAPGAATATPPATAPPTHAPGAATATPPATAPATHAPGAATATPPATAPATHAPGAATATPPATAPATHAPGAATATPPATAPATHAPGAATATPPAAAPATHAPGAATATPPAAAPATHAPGAATATPPAAAPATHAPGAATATPPAAAPATHPPGAATATPPAAAPATHPPGAATATPPAAAPATHPPGAGQAPPPVQHAPPPAAQAPPPVQHAPPPVQHAPPPAAQAPPPVQHSPPPVPHAPPPAAQAPPPVVVRPPPPVQHAPPPAAQAPPPVQHAPPAAAQAPAPHPAPPAAPHPAAAPPAKSEPKKDEQK